MTEPVLPADTVAGPGFPYPHNGGIRHAEGEVHEGLFESYCACGWLSGLTPDPMAAAMVLTEHQIAHIDGTVTKETSD